MAVDGAGTATQPWPPRVYPREWKVRRIAHGVPSVQDEGELLTGRNGAYCVEKAPQAVSTGDFKTHKGVIPALILQYGVCR